MLRAVADAQGSLGKNVTLSHGASKIGRKHLAGSSDIQTKVSREQLSVTFSSEDKTCSVTRIGGALSQLIRAEGGESIRISKTATHDVRPGDQLWLLAHTGGTHGGYVFEPIASVAPPAAPTVPAVVPASPAAPAPLAPVAAENSVDTPAWQKHLLGNDSVPAAGTDASGGGGRGSGGRGSGGGGSGGGGRDTCHYCQKIGHWANDCPEKGGKGSGSRGGGGGGECYNCGKTGHYARECRAPRKDNAAAAAKAKRAMDEEAITKAAAEAEETRRAQAEAKAAARAEAEEVAVTQERQKREAMETEGRSLNCVRAVVVPRREHASGRGPVPPAGAAERLACVRLRLADGRLYAEACDGVELLLGEAQPCSWTALPIGGDLVGELHDDMYDINQRVLRLQAAGCGLQAAGVAPVEEVMLALKPRTPADAAAATDRTVGGAMLLELIELGARLRPHVRGVRARNDGDAAALATREQGLAEEAEEVRRIEEEELAAFLPLLRAKKRRLAERQAEVVAKGIVVQSEGSPTGDGSSQKGSIQDGSRAEQSEEKPALQPRPLKGRGGSYSA